MTDISHEEYMIDYLRKDPGYAVELLNSILEDGGQEELAIALRRISAAFGSGADQSKDVGDMLAAIRAMGFRMTVTSAPASVPAKARRRIGGASAKPGAAKRAVRGRRTAAKVPAV